MSLPVSGLLLQYLYEHRFQDITTFVLYMTARDLKKSFTFDNKD